MNLGKALSRQGRFAEALAEFQMVCRNNNESTPVGAEGKKLGEETQRFLDLDKNLPRYLKGELKPANTAQILELAQVCSRKRLYASAVHFFQDAFAAQPNLLSQPASSARRFEAAQAAVQAATGHGVNEPAPTDQEKAALHKLGNTWLRVDLSALGKRLASDRAGVAQGAVRELRRWQQDDLLKPVWDKDKAAQAKLAEAERTSWQKFWRDVDDLIVRSYDPR